MAGNKYALIVDDEPLVTIYLEERDEPAWVFSFGCGE